MVVQFPVKCAVCTFTYFDGIMDRSLGSEGLEHYIKTNLETPVFVLHFPPKRMVVFGRGIG